jgi:RHS repeat-associated protein
MDGATYVEHIAYNAKGQRILISYGNGLMTRYAYDPQTFRLLRMRTESYATPLATPPVYHPSAASTPLQEFGYVYDLIGNVLSMVDRTPGCGVVNNPQATRVSDPALAQLLVAGNALLRNFSYDPLYRLLTATGRECKDISQPRPWTDDPRCGYNSGNQGAPNQDNAPNLTSIYSEAYAYDPVGNMISLAHTGTGSSWSRQFGIGGFTPQQWQQQWPAHLNSPSPWTNPPGNQLTHVGDNAPTTPQTHFFDASGNLVSETSSRHFEWDHSDCLRVFRIQTANAEPSVYAQYLYDSGGQRVKKLIRRQGGDFEGTVYIDGLFEHSHWTESGAAKQNNRLHVMDNKNRVALIRIGDVGSDDRGPAVQYHFSDHLGSSSAVVDSAGSWINREEYFSYGETSFGSFARKRYRFTGKERDEESGLNYHGARYFAPWLARWVSCDPLPQNHASNLYIYCRNSPIILIDSTGLADMPPPAANTPATKSVEITIDHIAARKGPLKGSPVEPSNLQLMTREDNSRKKAKLEGPRENFAPQSLADALQRGEFEAAAQKMLKGSFAQTVELEALWNKASNGGKISYDTAQEKFWSMVAQAKDPNAKLVGQALDVAGIRQMPGMAGTRFGIDWGAVNASKTPGSAPRVATPPGPKDHILTTPNPGPRGPTTMTTPNRGPQRPTVLTTPNPGPQGPTILTTPIHETDPKDHILPNIPPEREQVHTVTRDSAAVSGNNVGLAILAAVGIAILWAASASLRLGTAAAGILLHTPSPQSQRYNTMA